MTYLYLDRVDSTNNYSKDNIERLSDRTVVYTSKQDNGRGRFNRKWVDLGEGNIFLSIILKPSDKLEKTYSNLTQYTGLKLAETFKEYCVNPNIKWPNDILINGKKIAGILAETVYKNSELKGIIIGVGLNLNANKIDFASIDKLVTALNIETGKDVDKIEFLETFINNFFQSYDEFLKHGFISIKNAYEGYINFLGKQITINNLNTQITGIAQKITDDGAIVIDGKEFYTGDIL